MVPWLLLLHQSYTVSTHVSAFKAQSHTTLAQTPKQRAVRGSHQRARFTGKLAAVGTSMQVGGGIGTNQLYADAAEHVLILLILVMSVMW